MFNPFNEINQECCGDPWNIRIPLTGKRCSMQMSNPVIYSGII